MHIIIMDFYETLPNQRFLRSLNSINPMLARDTHIHATHSLHCTQVAAGYSSGGHIWTTTTTTMGNCGNGNFIQFSLKTESHHFQWNALLTKPNPEIHREATKMDHRSHRHLPTVIHSTWALRNMQKSERKRISRWLTLVEGDRQKRFDGTGTLSKKYFKQSERTHLIDIGNCAVVSWLGCGGAEKRVTHIFLSVV